jgi:hypothetical protein
MIMLASVVVGLVLLGLFLTVQGSVAGPSGGAQVAATSWSSGWQPIAQGATRTFTHSLGGVPEDYAVELWFKDTDGNLGINRRGYGAYEIGGQWYGAHWQRLTSNTIQVRRLAQDEAADQILVRVWLAPLPLGGYDSGWTDINPGQTITFPHNRSITSTDLSVGLWFSGTVRGIHQYSFGGLAIDGPGNAAKLLIGAHWHNLTDNQVQVTRHSDDVMVEQVRVIVLEGATPDYDSLVDLGGWQSVAQDTVFTFTHNLNAPPMSQLMRAECYDPAVLGINLAQAGGNVASWFTDTDKGVNIQNVGPNSVQVYRWADDDVCPQVRLRVWRGPVFQVYLPLTLRDY